ncbi:MAG: D-alanyl-D-alanine carboxypeptidase, partial [Candidatus Competibacteraceae bacterium]|nr:D-alanyl-D-alanine carboxypeptidase [Candidatus Competibacteraceae bacterium]
MLTTLWIVAGAALAQEGVAWSAPTIAARSAVLMNPTTGEILFAKEPHLRLPPASTTKVLTALVTLERLHLLARAPVSPQAASAPPSRVGLRAGEAVLVQDLLYGLMLKSGNDAAETLAEAAAGSIAGFAELMNLRAWQIGARDSHFMNPHGLPNDDHYTTAYDLALIFRQAMSHPVFADIVRTR